MLLINNFSVESQNAVWELLKHSTVFILLMHIGVKEVLILSRALETERLFILPSPSPPLSRAKIYKDLLELENKYFL